VLRIRRWNYGKIMLAEGFVEVQRTMPGDGGAFGRSLARISVLDGESVEAGQR
jgi:hypothetical protein